MKIGAMDVMWYDLPFKERITRIAELGFKGFQPWLLTAELGFKIPTSWFPKGGEFEHIDMSAQEFSRIVQEAGLEITCFGPHYILGEPPSFWGDPGTSGFTSEDNKRERIKDIKKLVTYSADAGVDIVGLFSGGDPIKKEYWDQLVDLMRIIVDFAEKSGVTLAMENMPQLLVDDEDSLLKLVKEINSKRLKINFDPKNLNALGRNVLDAVRKMRGEICYTHAGDSIPGGGDFGKEPGGKWIMPIIGKGTIPYREYVRTLKEIGYNGWIVIEYGGDERGYEPGMIESKEYLEEAFSQL
jgi:sugar phosphate isomerase/epimerase